MDSVSKLFELYLYNADLRPSSVRFKRMALRYFLEWFGDIAVGGCDLEIAEKYKILLKEGRSKSAANGYLANFKPFWEWLFRHGRIGNNPFYGIRLYRITKVRRQTFSAEELSRMLKVANQIWRVRICFGLLGMRRGEMLNVCKRDINLSAFHPHILLCPKKRSKDTWPWELKDHAVRYVALPERMYFDDIFVRLHDDIRELMINYWPYICVEEKYFVKLIQWQKEEKPNFYEDCLDPTGNLQRMFRSLQRRASIHQTKRFHELRAAFATKMIENTDLDRAAEALGHSNVQTTRNYNRVSEMSLVADMGRIAEKCYQTNVP